MVASREGRGGGVVKGHLSMKGVFQDFVCCVMMSRRFLGGCCVVRLPDTPSVGHQIESSFLLQVSFFHALLMCVL